MSKPDKKSQETKETLEELKRGELDGRCAAAKKIIKTRQAISDNPRASIKAILTNSIAIGCHIQERITREMQGRDLLTEDGRVDKLISQDLINVQRALLSSCALLGQLEGLLSNRKTKERNDKQARADRNRRIANMILEVSNDVDPD